MSRENPQEEVQTGVNVIREKIRNSPDAVEAEFERTNNTWLDCFTTRIFVIETHLDSRKTREELSPDQHQEAERKIQELKEFHRGLLDKYPNKDTIPPDDVKQELFRRLNILS